MLTEIVPYWTVDSAATDHIARDRNAYVDFCRIPKGSRSIYIGNNTSADVLGIGTCRLLMRKGRILYLHDVLYAPKVCRNLVCVLVLVKLGFKIVFEQDSVKVLLDNTVYGYEFRSYGFIVLDIIPINKTTSVFVTRNSSSSSSVNDVKWHARLGHIRQDRPKRLAKVGLLGSIDKIDFPVCEQCLAGKATRLPFGKAKRACFPLELIYSDICCRMNVRERHGAQYFITFIDDFTRFGHVYLISHRYEAMDCFKSYSALFENQLNTKIKSLQTHRGREYLYDLFKTYYDEKGIARQLTISYTPQQNGVAERMTKTLLDMVRSMMA